MLHWLLGGVILIGVSVALRHALGLDTRSAYPRQGLVPLAPDREAMFLALAREVETQAAMLAISLNDAIEERDRGHNQVAFRLLRLSASEWDRLGEIHDALLDVMTEYLLRAPVVMAPRSILARRFKSPLIVGNTRVYELLDKLVFRSRLRLQLQIRLLRRAGQALTYEFSRTCGYLERTGDNSAEVWSRLDLYLHDFDLVIKEGLLAFRGLLACLPPPLLAGVATKLRDMLEDGVRSTTLTTSP